ncbi:zinc-ribbon domain-containing protein [Candidatus Woesearchaeota archaeon]|nr:zinc-ribbon domain-containing protein [Candidatus Woesearchaeota archaeon]
MFLAKMKYCPDCGKKYQGKSKFCSHCGKINISKDNTAQPQSSRKEFQNEPKKSRRWFWPMLKIFLSVMLALIFIVGGNAVLFFLLPFSIMIIFAPFPLIIFIISMIAIWRKDK